MKYHGAQKLHHTGAVSQCMEYFEIDSLFEIKHAEQQAGPILIVNRTANGKRLLGDQWPNAAFLQIVPEQSLL